MGYILVIDDDPSVRATLRAVLTEEGHEVRVAADGASGVACAREEPPGVVLLDFSMPGMSGGEVLRALKADHPGLPVFFFTVYGDFPDKAELDEADCCFVKSGDLTPVLEAIGRALGPAPGAPLCAPRLGGRLRATSPGA